MPINHFGERVRFCMDLLGLQYDETDSGGLVNAFIFGQSVPYLIDRKSCSHIGNSDECIRYLYATQPEVMTSSAVRVLLQQTEETVAWENDLNKLGHAIQGWAYYYMLGPDWPLEGPLVCWGAHEPLCPLAHRIILRLFGQVFKAAMRKAAFKLDDEKLMLERKNTIFTLLDRVDTLVGSDGQGYLVGSQLTYVDISFCSLMAPMLGSKLVFASPSSWAKGRFKSFEEAGRQGVWKKMPHTLVEFEEQLAKRPSGKYVCRIYKEYRGRVLQ
eukprot:gnl/TRDRNA2_/TRDRNA2_79613_c0_seq1.p1 gnl/TRDRNA2_/TRDRNA2_79613_c0~~gnl/TRDRNA2_/TRDRNA2_79613_c0_seq1.p1  ORF type:complete len:271 (-),score=35.18 gnl/TRDRNA2_/TRDRNA2_79613_c0_seq1:124-936(-)